MLECLSTYLKLLEKEVDRSRQLGTKTFRYSLYLVSSFQCEGDKITRESDLELKSPFVSQLLDQLTTLAVPNQGRFVSKEPVHLKFHQVNKQSPLWAIASKISDQIQPMAIRKETVYLFLLTEYIEKPLQAF